jgi:hypothetical protein
MVVLPCPLARWLRGLGFFKFDLIASVLHGIRIESIERLTKFIA